MALDVTPIYRNLRTRVTFFGLEAEDLFAILAVAVVILSLSAGMAVSIVEAKRARWDSASPSGCWTMMPQMSRERKPER